MCLCLSGLLRATFLICSPYYYENCVVLFPRHDKVTNDWVQNGYQQEKEKKNVGNYKMKGHPYHQPDKKSRVRRFRRPTNLFFFFCFVFLIVFNCINDCTQSFYNWKGNGQHSKSNNRPAGEGWECSELV